jgi:hypothetical protein
MRSQEARYQPSSFQEQHKMNNPEIDMRGNSKHISEFSMNEPSFHRVKSGDAAHEISIVMQAAAKS